MSEASAPRFSPRWIAGTLFAASLAVGALVGLLAEIGALDAIDAAFEAVPNASRPHSGVDGPVRGVDRAVPQP